MIGSNTQSTKNKTSSGKPVIIVVLFVIMVVLVRYGYNTFKAVQAASNQTGSTTVTTSELEEKYGLRIQLLAVTAAGGLVDLRLQIVDAEKAKVFLSDHTNIPVLRVQGIVLQTSENAAVQDIQFEDGKSIFIMYPNAGNVLKSGDPVNIVFGNVQLETIQSK